MSTAIDPESSKVTADCHILPCKTDYAGKAQVDSFFCPAMVHADLQAAQFRGRGLLAAAPTQVQARVLTVHPDQGQVVNGVSVSRVSEWHHEHFEQAIASPSHINSSRIARALEWCHVTQLLHQPLAVPDGSAEK